MLHYWPSYEIVQEAFGPGRFKPDRLHIRQPVLDYVMALFKTYYCVPGDQAPRLAELRVRALEATSELPPAARKAAEDSDPKTLARWIGRRLSADDREGAELVLAYALELYPDDPVRDGLMERVKSGQPTIGTNGQSLVDRALGLSELWGADLLIEPAKPCTADRSGKLACRPSRRRCHVSDELRYQFVGGYPTPETVARVRDELDLNRAVQVYRQFFPKCRATPYSRPTTSLGSSERGLRHTRDPAHACRTDAQLGHALRALAARPHRRTSSLRRPGRTVEFRPRLWNFPAKT